MKDKQSAIPKATAKRLSLYYRIFKRFHAEKIERANSKQIAEAIGIDSATVRRDFSYFGELGRRGFGYDVKKLMTFFADLLNDNSITNVMLVGIGNMGHALLHYRFHERNKMKIIINKELTGAKINITDKFGLRLVDIFKSEDHHIHQEKFYFLMDSLVERGVFTKSER